MKSFGRRISILFFAGAIGGLVNSLAVWAFGRLGVTAMAGVKLAPALTKEWLYPRLVWGGIWGLIFLLPIMKNSAAVRGTLLSLAPTAVQLFVIFPQRGQGPWGLDLGMLTPLFVFLFNAIWGIAAALWLKAIREERKGVRSWSDRN